MASRSGTRVANRPLERIGHGAQIDVEVARARHRRSSTTTARRRRPTRRCAPTASKRTEALIDGGIERDRTVDRLGRRRRLAPHPGGRAPCAARGGAPTSVPSGAPRASSSLADVGQPRPAAAAARRRRAGCARHAPHRPRRDRRRRASPAKRISRPPTAIVSESPSASTTMPSGSVVACETLRLGDPQRAATVPQLGQPEAVVVGPERGRAHRAIDGGHAAAEVDDVGLPGSVGHQVERARAALRLLHLAVRR